MLKPISNIDLKKIELDILKYIDHICLANSIKYSLAYGTMLGAIRHNGYIPWDDDIDICMDRSNFERFVLACKNDKNERFALLWLDTESKYTLPLPKVVDKSTLLTQKTQSEKMSLGVYVDVFIFDSLPNDVKRKRKFIRKLDFYQRLWGYSQIKYIRRDHSFKSLVRKIVYGVFHLINPRFFSVALNHYAQKYNRYQDSEYIGSMVYTAVRRDLARYRKTFFDECPRMKFEDYTFPVSIQYDEALKMCYGDYMQLPPVEKQCSHHDFEAFYRN